MERRTKVQPVEINYQCDVCGKGDLMEIGSVRVGQAVEYMHKCKACGTEHNFIGKRYPRIEFVSIKD